MHNVMRRFRTERHGDLFAFEFRQQHDGHFDIFCFEHPTTPLDTSVSRCHIYPTGEVCVRAGREPLTLDRAIAIATVWAEGYSHYCRTGRFPRGTKKVHV